MKDSRKPRSPYPQTGPSPICRKNPNPRCSYSSKMHCTLPSGHTGVHRYEWIDPERRSATSNP